MSVNPESVFNGIFSVVPFLIIVPLIIFIIVFVMIFTLIKKNLSHKNIDRGINQVGQMFQNVSNNITNNIPCSLSDCESIYLPQIMQDFPDFNATLAYTYAKEALRMKLSAKTALKIHKVVISGYKRAAYDKTVIMQAALQYPENGVIQQKMYVLLYTYLIENKEQSLSANCPNCGAPVSDSAAKICPYCDSRLVNPFGGSWTFHEIYEG